jgi:hypothetical protein
MSKYVFVVCLMALMSGCATMSKEECALTDWYVKGADDATHGLPLDRVIEYGKDCAKAHIVPDMKAYRAGHEKGARLYCVASKGYTEGRAGAQYNNICPLDLEPKFLQAYRDGQELYLVQSKINSLTSQLNSGQSRIDNNHREIEQLKYDVVRSPSEQDRRNTMRRIDELENDIRNIINNADRAAYELDIAKDDYRRVEDKHHRMGYIQ